MSISICTFDRSPEQVAALKSLAEWWGASDNFWPVNLTLDAARRPGSLIVYAAETDEWLGAALVEMGAYESELLYLYTRPEERGKGLARLLLAAVRDKLMSRRQMTALFLEVRTVNEPAIALYESLQMERIGIRKKYYANGDDAYVYRWRLLEELPFS